MKPSRAFLVVVTANLFGACSGAERPGETSTPAQTVETVELAPSAELPRPTTEPLSSAEPAPSTTAVPEPPPAAPPEVGFTDLVDSPGDTRLDAAAAHLVAGKLLEARRALTKSMPEIDGAASLDVKLGAHTLLGRSCVALNDTACANTQFELVRTLWKDPAAGAKSLDSLPGDDDAKRRRVARALMAVGEALYHAAEAKRLLSEKERVPVYKGKGDKESVMKHVNTKTAEWVKARRKLIEEAEAAYIEIARLPVPPPYWVVASASQVGRMWSKFVAEFRAAPIPKEWMGAGVLPGSTVARDEIRAAYYAAIDEASEPHQTHARAAFEMCENLAKKFTLKNEYTAQCEDWLQSHPAPPSP